jgi:hypothetical protein
VFLKTFSCKISPKIEEEKKEEEKKTFCKLVKKNTRMIQKCGSTFDQTKYD